LSVQHIERTEPELESKNPEGATIMTNELIVVLVTVVFAILGFLIFRAIVLWYWRINDQIALLESIDEKLEQLINKEPHV
jgi:hypothetical protein